MTESQTRKPNFFIVGAPKCGTTALYQFLRQHPEVFMPGRKEPHYFGSDLKSPGYLSDVGEYLGLFSEAGEAKRIGEASVWYLYSECAAEEIRAFSPSSRIIMMLRNPLKMVYSYHSQRLYFGNEDIVDFAAALDSPFA